jgi:nuclear pore complex protein Nup85
MPPDTTSQEDMLLAALFTNDPVKAASLANDIDIWLACHLTDLLECLALDGVAPVMS